MITTNEELTLKNEQLEQERLNEEYLSWLHTVRENEEFLSDYFENWGQKDWHGYDQIKLTDLFHKLELSDERGYQILNSFDIIDKNGKWDKCWKQEKFIFIEEDFSDYIVLSPVLKDYSYVLCSSHGHHCFEQLLKSSMDL